MMGLFERMGYEPQAARVDKYLTSNWVAFASLCEPDWMLMTIAQKTQRLRDHVKQKFSVDPKRQRMQPAHGTKRCQNDAKWLGFEMSDDESEFVIAMCMEGYQKQP